MTILFIHASSFSFMKQINIEDMPCAQHCSKSWGDGGKQNIQNPYDPVAYVVAEENRK